MLSVTDSGHCTHGRANRSHTESEDWFSLMLALLLISRFTLKKKYHLASFGTLSFGGKEGK